MRTPAHAADIPDANRIVTYHVVDQDVAGVIGGIAAQLGVRVDVSSSVQGDVHGRLPAGTVRATLDRLASLYSFDWYFDGQTLFATSMAQAQSKVLPLGAVPADDLLQTLAAFGVSDQRWPVRISRAGGMAYVSGPPRLVGMTENVLSALAQRASAATADVRVFRGSSAGS
jgi:type II secretory pathway component GspD/PulD (secretin)